MVAEMKAASALGAKTARACENCVRRRARWFCATDDAFLCHGCDNLVHSANELASRHERVPLHTASSSKVNALLTPNKVTAKAWHSGFTRKARTPRHNNKHLSLQQQQPKDEGQGQVLFNNTSTLLPVVPELGSEEQEPLLNDETEEQTFCRVPVFDPFDAELCNIYSEVKDERLDTTNEEAFDLDDFSEFLPSDMDLAEFAADVESLLENNGVDDQGNSGLELFDCNEEDEIDAYAKGAMVKVKDEQLEADHTASHLESVLGITNNSEAFNWKIDFESHAAAAQEEEEKAAVPVAVTGSADEVGTNKRKIFLRLNYEEVITAWASQGSPWTTGSPSKFNSDDCRSDYLDSIGADVQCSYGEVRSLRGHPIGHGDGEREARVSRYREKRRTRLFAKKIRYEVRKLNAEKRPRMKGRFVKRSSFLGATAFPAYNVTSAS